MLSKSNNLKKNTENDFNYLLEQFADLKIMRYQVPGFDELELEQKELIYYLSEAALCGRDIIFDQNYKHNLSIRRTNETILTSFKGDKSTPEFKIFEVYAKRVWFSNGIHHHYSTDKFIPKITPEYFTFLINKSDFNSLPLLKNECVKDFTRRIIPILFDKNTDQKKIVLDDEKDIIADSATNFYVKLNKQEVLDFNASQNQKDANKPLALGLNSQLVKQDNTVFEKVYKVGGLYGKAIEKIIFWLDKAMSVAENNKQKQSIALLIGFYKTGDLKIWDEYNVNWVQDLESQVDFVNGFIETYGDPLGIKATWESLVNFKDFEATKRTEIISSNAQWFENNAPIDSRFRKKKVTGISAKVITAAQLGGDCYPTTPIGINLPNADWIRRDYGSKSVTIENITFAYEKAAQGNGFLEEYCYSQKEIELSKTYGSRVSNLHTDLHECLGHGSGQLLPGTSSEALKNYSSTLEEARADLFALYYLADKKMIDLGLIPSFDAAITEYNSYFRNGLLTQLTRIKLGDDIEQAHMRNRQLITKWCFEKGAAENIIEMPKRNGKTYVKINDYKKLQHLIGTLLAEIQRIKSEGDYEAGKLLVENYAVKIDKTIHNEVLERFSKLNISPYGGFINPVFKPETKKGKITNVIVEYPDNYSEQMLWYSKEYSFLPDYN